MGSSWSTSHEQEINKDDGTHYTYYYEIDRVTVESMTTVVHGEITSQEEWHENGQLRSNTEYVNGHRHGLCQSWYPDGQKETEFTFQNDRIHGTYRAWHSNGQLAYECTYVNSRKQGLQTSWYETGEKDAECTFVNDKLHGVWKRWYTNGNLWMTAEDNMGAPDGLELEFALDGTLAKPLVLWINGEERTLSFMKERIAPFKEELIAAALHPRRMEATLQKVSQDYFFEHCY
jgi:antitoxin component YwqK of YwqJK toxin-antitoxin module